MTNTINDETTNQEANNGLGKLDKRPLSQHGISFETKLDVYNIYLSSLLYEYKTWVTYRKHMKRLEQFRQLVSPPYIEYPAANLRE